MRLPPFRLNAAWIFALALLVRMVVMVQFSHSSYFSPAEGDMKFYSDWGQALSTGWKGTHSYYGLPGYALALSGLFRLTGFSPYTVAAIQTLSESAIATLIFSLAAWAFPGPRAKVAGALAALGWVFFQPAQAFSVVTMPTTWGVLAFWGILAWSVRTESRRTWWPWPAIGLLAGLAATAVATVLCVLPVTVVAAWRALRKPLPVAAALALLLAGVGVGTAPCWYHNWVVMKDPVLLSGHSGLNFWIGNNPWSNGYPMTPPGLRATQAGMLKDSILTVEAQAGHELKRAEISRYWSDKAKAYIRENPGQWLGLLCVKARNFWSATQYDDLSLINPLREEGVLTPGLRFGAVAVAGLAGIALTWRRYPRSRWMAGAVLLALAALLPVFVTERYRLGAVPGLLILGAGGLTELFDALLACQWLRSGTWLGAGAAAVLLTHIPQPGSKVPDWLDDFNSGRQALEQGNLTSAREKLERAATGSPANPDILTALGTYWLRMHSAGKAREYYTQALAANPRLPTALNNLAIIEMQERHWARAEELLLQALAIDSTARQTQELAAYCTLQLQKEGKAPGLQPVPEAPAPAAAP